jgi:hypothetical protein
MAQLPEITAYVNKQKDYNTRTGAAIDGIVADIQALNNKIQELQNTPPVLDPADQALLDEIDVMGSALATKAEALDAQNPPPPPPA